MGDNGAKIEDIVACALSKEIHYLEDCFDIQGSLHYLGTKDNKEIDFAVFSENKPLYVIEVTDSDTTISSNFNFFEKIKPLKKIQLVYTLDREKTYRNGTEIRNVVAWLAKLDLKENV
jgi:uncharacterized protein